MLKITSLLMLIALVWSCQEEGTVIEGQIANAANMQVFLDEVRIGKPTNVIDKGDLDADGNFKMVFPEGLSAGIYNLRFGAKRISIALDGNEKNLSVAGDLNTLQTYDFEVTGSADSKTVVSLMQSLIRREYKPADIQAFVDTVSNPYVAAYAAYTAVRNNGQFLAIHKKANERLLQAYPDTDATLAYGEFVNSVAELAAQKQRSAGPISVGMEAPDIRLPNPDGREYALSDLRGKVVLLDFWASWCGPCRRENPAVVAVYDRYKAQGFTVFSVSLDGLDSRGRARFQGENLQVALDGQKQRWVSAIEQDRLAWEYHVSDLQKWESTAGRLYGVSSIPRTFMIDREGKIAAVNLRGAAAIEAALKDLI